MGPGLSAAEFERKVREHASKTVRAGEALRAEASARLWANLTTGGDYSPGTPIDTGNARAGWRRVVRGAVETFTNAVSYIRPLEYGHSKQAPNGFVRLTVRHWPEIVRDARAAVLRRGGV